MEEKGGVTVHDHLLATGADDREAAAAETLIARVVPLGRPVVLTEDVLAAARAGNAALVALLLAEEIESEPEDQAALDESLRQSSDERMGHDELRRQLGIE